MFKSQEITELLLKISKIPGFSKKSAEKFMYWVFEKDSLTLNLLFNEIQRIKEETKFCTKCSFFLDKNNNCEICNDKSRKNVLLVLENLTILNKIEKSNIFNGKYFIFEKKIKSNTDYQNNLDYINEFVKYSKEFDEVILGISPTLEGEILNNILKDILKTNSIKVSHLAIGVPLGASVDYIDETTLKMSIKNRQTD
ncbi:recombination protein RecR [Mycoplasmopsis felis]|uniref:recombination protein RecR n=1 Tax=Mycoplasmopsis felis TaxID=33923 RepID=UPI002AF6BF68|nr:recombination protein RecR [Mycoplasmopsis felis]WQQ01498.1 recombination protein RecR [Mycoplasmopsis felis]WQQ07864.1 recombination protein RecR [Mycoplasmopsis felis]WQQ08679.1 recombination protein RecR [Mycoplasmopsis felis]WQQ09938.1 recombination protein RecR [Mycoplasmopsis felis]WQQ10780.1 recombination protein RecR [Mycoplasmopsis felis]